MTESTALPPFSRISLPEFGFQSHTGKVALSNIQYSALNISVDHKLSKHQFENLPKLEQIAESAATAAVGQIFEFSPTDLTVPGGVSPAYRRGNQIAYFGLNH